MAFTLGAALGLSTLLYSAGVEGGVSPALVTMGVLLAFLGIAGITFAHAGMNLFDDYFDMKKGAVAAREKLTDGGFRARLGKCSYLKDGSVTLADTRRVATVFIAIALAAAAIIFALRGWEILLFAGITLLLGLSYAGPPLRLSYRGLGELVVGIVFGPVLVIAASFVVCGEITMLAVFSSIPVGLLVANIVHMHAVMDFEPDKAAGRTTLAILLGSPQTAVAANVLFVGLAQTTILLGVALGYLPLLAVLVVLTYPLSFVFVRRALGYAAGIDGRDAPFVPQRWMGGFGDWEKYRAADLDWFMSRWMLARNLVIQVTLILAITGFTPWYL